LKSKAVRWGSISRPVGFGNSVRETWDPDAVHNIDERKIPHGHFMLKPEPGGESKMLVFVLGLDYLRFPRIELAIDRAKRWRLEKDG
jgi:hypothetical protein